MELFDLSCEFSLALFSDECPIPILTTNRESDDRVKVAERRPVMRKRVKRRLLALLVLAGIGLLFSKRHHTETQTVKNKKPEPPAAAPAV